VTKPISLPSSLTGFFTVLVVFFTGALFKTVLFLAGFFLLLDFLTVFFGAFFTFFIAAF
jgi:hypothetical protein